MMKQLFAQVLQGFTVKDLPFLIFQLALSAVLAWIIRYFWRKNELSDEETNFLDYLLPIQIVFTTIAIFSIKLPWITVLFGILSLIPLLGNTGFNLKSKVFYILCLFIAFGCGAANPAVTFCVTVLLVVPVLFLYHSKKQ